jgi:hypothetical protein
VAKDGATSERFKHRDQAFDIMKKNMDGIADRTWAFEPSRSAVRMHPDGVFHLSNEQLTRSGETGLRSLRR